MFFAEVNVGHFNWLGRREAEHLLRVHTALKNVCEDISCSRYKLVTLTHGHSSLIFLKRRVKLNLSSQLPTSDGLVQEIVF